MHKTDIIRIKEIFCEISKDLVHANNANSAKKYHCFFNSRIEKSDARWRPVLKVNSNLWKDTFEGRDWFSL